MCCNIRLGAAVPCIHTPISIKVALGIVLWSLKAIVTQAKHSLYSVFR